MESPQRSAKVIDICRISPPPTLPDESLPLTFFDILWLRQPPATCIYFYKLSETNSFYDSIIPKLKHSLSLSLINYVPLAGHFVWPENSPKPFIQYISGDGVSFTVAESDHVLDLDVLSRPVEEFNHLVPKLASSREQTEAIAVQVTLLPGSGFCIGFTCHHAIMDGKSSTSFVKFWARVCRDSAIPKEDDHRPFYDRTVLKDPAGLEAIYLAAWLDDDGPGNKSVEIWKPSSVSPGSVVRGTFEITREKILKLRRFLNNPPVSTFSIIASYTIVCYAKATAKKNSAAVMLVAFAADLRHRMNPSLPENYFGNCMGWTGFESENEILLGEDGVSKAMEEIHKAVKSLDCEDVLAGAETYASIVLDSKAKLVNSGDVSSDKKSSPTYLSIVGSPKFGLYSTDFGFGRPEKVEMVSVDKAGVISLFDSKNGSEGGLQIGLVLNSNEMEAFAFEFFNGLDNL